MDISSERVSIPLAGGGSMGGYLARPKTGGPFPAVLVYMEIFGVNRHIRDVVERVAREGFLALAPDYFHRSGPGVEYGYDDAGMAGGMKLLGALRADEMIADAKAAIAWLRQRPDVRRAERELAAETARVGVATAELYPSLSLVGSIGLEASAGNALFSSGAGTAAVGTNLVQSILDFGRRRGNIEAQDAVREQAFARYGQTVLVALEEVENALVAFAEEQERRLALREAAGAAGRATALSRYQYTSGLVDFESVLVAERSLFSLQDQLATSEGEVTANLIRLYKALGGGWTPGSGG